MGLILKQYDIVIVNLDPTMGSELRKTRPCVILSPDEMNKYLKTIIIAPITSKSKPYPTRVVIEWRGKENWVVVDQIRTIDKRRIYKKMGRLKPVDIQNIKAVIQETLVD
ncbi:MAG: type II toxin-antitoxin system PemK/MazF family toxin [Chitinophagales bacterium]